MTRSPHKAPRLSVETSPISRGDTVLEAARRLMRVEYRNMRCAEEGLAGGNTAEALHDLRVANRRLRALLRIFSKPLNMPRAANLVRRLAVVSRAMGPARDLEVWSGLWESSAQNAASNDRSYERYTEHLRRLKAGQMRVVLRTIRSRTYVRLCSRLSAFITTELDPNKDWSRRKTLPRFASKQFTRSIRKMESHDDAPLDRASDALHAYRKAIRRARYVAEFFAPVLPAWGTKAAETLHKMATELGLIHDIDVGVDRHLVTGFSAYLEGCRHRLSDRRAGALARLKQVRRRFRRTRWYRDARRDTPVR